jgi:drug/metabolite transporter (DMT)-like permease
MALLDRVIFGVRLRPVTIVGLVLGFTGVAILVRPEGSSAQLISLLAVVFASLSWASGSLYARRAPLPARPLVGAGMEMFAGGVVLGLVGLAGGELSRVHLADVSRSSLLALAYLIVVGALAFSAYVWVLRNAPTTLVSTYAFVNPVVAVFLGWGIQDEAVTARTLAAAAVIVVGVAAIVTGQARASLAATPVASGGDPAAGVPAGAALEA